MTLRVLHIGKFWPPDRGGMETFVSELVHTQRAQGMDSRVLVHGQPQASDPPWVTRVSVQFSLVYTPFALGFGLALRRAFREFDPHVLHLHLPNVAAFWALVVLAAHRVPWVVHWHSDVMVAPGRWRLRLAYGLYRPFEQALLEYAECVVVTSPPYLAASEPLQRWRDKCCVIPLALGAFRVPAATLDAAPAVRWLPGRLRVLSLGRLAHYKGFDTLIRAVCAAPRVQLIIAGAGETQAHLQTVLAQCWPHPSPAPVQLVGAVSESEKHRLLADCEVFCLASTERTEAFGMVLLEAMAYAKPCVVSALPGSGMPWVVASSGAGLYQVPVGDVPAWRETLEALVDQGAQRAIWGQAGQRALQTQFSMSSCAERLASLYRQCLREPQPGPDRPHTLIVIPARDEAATLGDVVRGLRARGWHHVLVIDDQSQDGTGDLAEQAGARVVRPAIAVGAWGGMQLGLRYALEQGYAQVITMDADGQHEVAEIETLVQAVQQPGVDVVIGSHPQRASWMRRLAWRWFRLLAGFEVHDLTSGFRLYNRRAIRALAGSQATLIDYQDIGVLLLLRRAGMQVVEVPVSMNPRQVGRSKIFSSWARVARYMLATTLLCLTGLRPPRAAKRTETR
ncbi:MAG: hypothetical protein Fur007_04210 [Rhodoferax sp.]